MSVLLRLINRFTAPLPEGFTGGSARFATAQEMMRCRDNPAHGALVYGDVWRGDLPWALNRTVSVKDDRPVLIIAPTRSGKGRSQIIRNVLSYPGSVVSIDPKGEAALVTAEAKLRQGHRVHLLDPFGVCARLRGVPRLGIESSFDPLSMIDRDSDSAADDIRSLVEILVMDDSEYWGPQTRQFIAGMFARFLMWNPKPLPIGALFPMLAMPEGDLAAYLDRLGHGVSQENALGLLFHAGKESYLGKERKSRDILKQCTMNALAIFSSPRMQEVMEPGSWTFEDVQRRPSCVFLVLPPDKLISHAQWLRVMVHCAMTGMARGPKPKYQTLTILDEFANLGRMEQIKAAVSYASGLGIKLMIVVQDVGQLKEHYEDCYSTFFGNAGAVVVLGANDPGTRREISDLLGNAKMIKRKEGITQMRGDRLTEQSVPLLTPDEIGRYCSRETGGMLLLLQGMPPMRLKRRYYDEVLTAGVDYTVHPDFGGKHGAIHSADRHPGAGSAAGAGQNPAVAGAGTVSVREMPRRRGSGAADRRAGNSAGHSGAGRRTAGRRGA